MGDGIADVPGVFKGAHPAEGNQAAVIKHPFGIGPWADETMEDRADLLPELRVDGKRVFKRCISAAVAGMDDDIELGCGGQFEVLAQQRALAFAEGGLLPTCGRGVEIIETALANRTHPWISDKGFEPGGGIVRRMVDITWMDADAGMDAGSLR